ncbi:MAG: transcription antitermination factor NusB [Firmicutes bacterium]|nr:transcription antitermination factor NusB [Bacillota bacterium]
MSRKEARECAFQLIYERIITGEKNALTFELFSEKHAGEADYLTSAYLGVDEKMEFLQRVIARYAKDFKVERIFKVDSSLLLLSIFEILFMPDIHDRVAVNEALELVKVYSTERSSGFVNGVLASVLANKEALVYEYEHPGDSGQ